MNTLLFVFFDGFLIIIYFESFKCIYSSIGKICFDCKIYFVNFEEFLLFMLNFEEFFIFALDLISTLERFY